jgi:hypothetical protein
MDALYASTDETSFMQGPPIFATTLRSETHMVRLYKWRCTKIPLRQKRRAVETHYVRLPDETSSMQGPYARTPLFYRNHPSFGDAHGASLQIGARMEGFQAT